VLEEHADARRAALHQAVAERPRRDDVATEILPVEKAGVAFEQAVEAP
jgi:hypothetical protein